MNGWLNPAPPPRSGFGIKLTGCIIYHTAGDLSRPGSSKVWLFMDENPWSINDAFMVINPLGHNLGGPPRLVSRQCLRNFILRRPRPDSRQWHDQAVINYTLADAATKQDPAPTTPPISFGCKR